MPERPSGLLWVIFLAYFTFGMITNVLGVIIPEVIKQYDLSLFAAGLLAFSFFLAYGLCSIPTGLLMDRFGAKPLSNSFSRQWRSILGSGMRIGHTLSQRPQRVEAFGRWPASAIPMIAGVRTEPIGPG